ncbi:MAG TPA: DUF5686 family protein, partial [Balneolaceae bacterium]|nr:DUF5686 family protein [Balneolaceae bacterium]
MLRNLFLILLLLIAGLSLPAQAQKTIHGTITDAKTGEALPNANLLIKGTYRGTISNLNGEYSLTIPDSLLPATLLVRYIGYHSQEQVITQTSKNTRHFALQPSVTQLGSIVVTYENPADRIMRKVIERKQQWRKKLSTYRADAYTRQTLANDTSIVSITESISEIFWHEEKGHREVLKSKRQTANIEADNNFAGVRYLPNLYDDNVEIAGFKLVGVTHPDALDYYNFKLLGHTSLDDQTVFKIQVIPDRNLQPLFKGTIFVLDEAFALLKVNLAPNSVVSFPPPIKSFSTYYRQQFSNFGKAFWLPVDIRISGDIKIDMLGLEFPLIQFKQISRITNYRVNVPLPDSLYADDDSFIVDEASVNSDSLFAGEMKIIPLSVDEKEAYATIDSTATLEEAFKPTGFLANLMDDDDDDDENSGSGRFNLNIPGSLSPDLRYNRVDELFAGFNYEISPFDPMNFSLNGGYSTGYNEWSYGAGVSLEGVDIGPLNASTGLKYSAQTAQRYTSHIYKPYFMIIPNLLGSRGYFDFYRSEGYRVFTKWEYSGTGLSLALGFNSKKHSSLSTATAYDLLGSSTNFRMNPFIDEGLLRSVDVVFGYNLNEGYNFGVAGQKKIRFEIEHSSSGLGSDFNFTRYETRIAWSFPTFYQRRLISNTLDLGLKAGTFSGDLPFQKWGIIDGAVGIFAPYGILRAIRGRPYEGEQYVAFHAEHNFQTIPFEILGLTPLVEQNIGLIVFTGAAKTWGPDWSLQQQQARLYVPKTTDGIHWEAGVSLNHILDFFRIDFALRLDEPAFLVNVGL